MNNHENKPEDLFERLKGGSVFSFLKAADGPAAGTPPPRPEPLTRPETVRQAQDNLELKNRLAELEAKIKKLEADAIKPASAPAAGVSQEVLSGLESRLAALESRPIPSLEAVAPVPDPEVKLKQMLGNTEGAIRILLEEYRCLGEKKSAEAARHLTELSRAVGQDRQVNSENVSELERRLKVVEVELGGTLEQIAAALENALKEGEGVLRGLLAEERGLREETSLVAAGRLEKLEQEAVNSGQEKKEVLAELNRLGEDFKSGAKSMRDALAAAQRRMEALARSQEEGENEMKKLISEDRCSRGEAEAKTAALLGKFEQGTVEIKEDLGKLYSEVAKVQKDVLGIVVKVLDEERERLETLAVKTQADIMNAAGVKFSSLKSLWEGAAVEIRNAQKTAYCAVEKCEKLENALYFLDQKAGSLERKYSRYTEAAAKPDNAR